MSFSTLAGEEKWLSGYLSLCLDAWNEALIAGSGLSQNATTKWNSFSEVWVVNLAI